MKRVDDVGVVLTGSHIIVYIETSADKPLLKRKAENSTTDDKEWDKQQ
jgi:hypothetical protein